MKRIMLGILFCLLLASWTQAAKNEWVLGQPADTYSVDEWSVGQPIVAIDGSAAPPAGNPQVITIIMSSLPGFLIFGLVYGLAYSEKKVAA